MIRPWHTVWDSAAAKMDAINPASICNFGIKPLDDALIGILKKDLVVIGADSGAGKSEICIKIALHNAQAGRKVALYFIEGGGEEALYRIQWELIRDRYYSQRHTGVDMDYRKWRMNTIKDEIILKLRDHCRAELMSLIKENLQVYTFDSSFSLADLTESLGYFLKPQGDPEDLLNYKHDVDLIIIDHLQYFTLINPKDELNEISNILKKINEITHHHEIPIILISHLRKKDKDRGLPAQEDFFGTSNIAKMASVAITISSGDQDRTNPNIYPTYFRFVKTRTKISSNIGLLCNFDLINGKYEQSYEAYKLYRDVPDGKPLLNHELPRWATGARK